MDSPQEHEACVEHKLRVEDKNEKGKRLKIVQRGQWLRAALLGANDGLLSTTSLMLGVGAAKEDQQSMILSGLAGAIAGACSMAVGEFVSVATQRDIEMASLRNSSPKTELCGQENGGDIKLHIISSADGTTTIDTTPTRTNLAMSPVLTPLRSVYKNLTCDCERVSVERASPAMTPERKSPIIVSSAKSPIVKVIAVDARTDKIQGEKDDDEKEVALPNPYKAATASALSFLGGSVVPLLPALLVRQNAIRVVAIVVVTSFALAILGGLGACLGGSPVRASAVRILLGGWVSMAITYGLLKPLDRDSKGHEAHD